MSVYMTNMPPVFAYMVQYDTVLLHLGALTSNISALCRFSDGRTCVCAAGTWRRVQGLLCRHTEEEEEEEEEEATPHTTQTHLIKGFSSATENVAKNLHNALVRQKNLTESTSEYLLNTTDVLNPAHNYHQHVVSLTGHKHNENS